MDRMRSIILFLLFLITVSLGFNSYFLVSTYRSQTVTSVPDGDSLDLTDGRRIRLLGTDAPEKGRCGNQEARDRLIGLTQGKRVELTDIVKDDYGRQLANVSVGSQLVNQVMVAEGLSRYTSVKSSQSTTMIQASDRAKNEQLGIFSPICRSLVPPQPSCTIKGNIKNSQRTYHLSNCPNYSQTIVDLSYGDQWFCTEKEAQEEGFTKASGCK